MLNKAKRADLEIVKSNDWDPIYQGIYSELHGKFSGMTEISMDRLKNLYASAAQNNLLHSFAIRKDNTCLGGIICIEKNGILLYSKGAAIGASKENGGMYAAVDAAITYAAERKLHFDFGGSRVEGVRRFNHAFGAEDLTFFSYRIDKSPRWFQWVREIKRRWFKKS